MVSIASVGRTGTSARSSTGSALAAASVASASGSPESSTGGGVALTPAPRPPRGVLGPGGGPLDDPPDAGQMGGLTAGPEFLPDHAQAHRQRGQSDLRAV